MHVVCDVYIHTMYIRYMYIICTPVISHYFQCFFSVNNADINFLRATSTSVSTIITMSTMATFTGRLLCAGLLQSILHDLNHVAVIIILGARLLSSLHQ